MMLAQGEWGDHVSHQQPKVTGQTLIQHSHQLNNYDNHRATFPTHGTSALQRPRILTTADFQHLAVLQVRIR